MLCKEVTHLELCNSFLLLIIITILLDFLCSIVMFPLISYILNIDRQFNGTSPRFPMLIQFNTLQNRFYFYIM